MLKICKAYRIKSKIKNETLVLLECIESDLPISKNVPPLKPHDNLIILNQENEKIGVCCFINFMHIRNIIGQKPQYNISVVYEGNELALINCILIKL